MSTTYTYDTDKNPAKMKLSPVLALFNRLYIV